jgi:hypothetical protein
MSIIENWRSVIERPLLLRVVRCLPRRAGVSGRDEAQRAGVVQASGEEIAGCTDAFEVAYKAMGICGFAVVPEVAIRRIKRRATTLKCPVTVTPRTISR